MGRGPRARLAVAALTLAFCATARGEPIFPEPVPGKARWGDDNDAGELALLAEVRALGVLTADRLASWPALRLGLQQWLPALVTARAGLMAELHDVPLKFVGRADIGIQARPYFEDGVGPVSGLVIDDLYADWKPSRAFELVVGRARVPWSKTRQVDEIDEPFGAPPFLIDRIAPDRRWGALVLGDLGAVSWSAGAWEDVDELEPRVRVGDPSSGGVFAGGVWLEWTPRAPLNGADIGPKSHGPLPTFQADPWYGTWRYSLGAGALARLREDGSTRFDLALSALMKWGWFSAQAEALFARDRGDLQLGGHLELMVVPIERVAFSIRGELDGGAPNGGEWSAAAALQYHVTKDRRNRIGVVGWLRRDEDRGTPYDALVVFLQASL